MKISSPEPSVRPRRYVTIRRRRSCRLPPGRAEPAARTVINGNSPKTGQTLRRLPVRRVWTIRLGIGIKPHGIVCWLHLRNAVHQLIPHR